MEATFWHERWAANQIGFHQGIVNPFLIRYWPQVNASQTGTVLVPLCGKAVDLIWLLAQGYHVLGVELSDIATAAFFQENAHHFTTPPQVRHQGAFTIWSAQTQTERQIEIWCGDFFHLQVAELPPITACYDRAALIALPPAMRPRYQQHIASLLKPTVEMLLITLSYPQALAKGPPFSVPAEEVSQLYQADFSLTLLETQEEACDIPKFKERGIMTLTEQVFKLVRVAA